MPLAMEGFPVHSIFALRKGTLKAVHMTPSGREQVLRVYTPGTFVGLDALALDAYPYSLEAATPVLACHAPRDAVAELISSSPEFSRAVIGELCVELGRARRDLATLGTRTAIGRVATVLLQAFDEARGVSGGPVVGLPLNRRDTAAMLGMAEESLSRQLTQLEQLGVVSRRGRRLEIRDAGRLQAIAEA